jgi:hypothetical protein
MLEPSEVLVKARTYLGEVIPEFAALNPKVDEMELSHYMTEMRKWIITFYAHSGDNPKVGSLADVIRRQRIEKVVSVDAEDGHLISVSNPGPPF